MVEFTFAFLFFKVTCGFVSKALTLKMRGHIATESAQVEIPPFQPAPESRIMGCGQKTSEELDTSHSSFPGTH